MSVVTKIAYLAEGKLYLSDGSGAEGKLVESPFVQGILDRVERNRERNEWKSQGGAWNVNAGGMMGGLPGMAGAVPVETRRIRFTSVAGGGPGKLLYSLDTDHVGGLFRRDLVEDHEQRLLHRQQLRAGDIARRASDGSLALSLARQDGSAHLAVMSPEGRGLNDMTEGDAVDQSPSWSEDGESIFFQSAGVGRNAGGYPVSLGPYAICRLDQSAKSVTTEWESESHDHLMPRQVGGALYCIRRPYNPEGASASPWKMVTDVLLFPFRLGRAVVHFLNFMSLMFARKPLITSGGPPKEGPDQRFLMVFGKMIDAEKALKQQGDKSGGALVPAAWQLVKRNPDGTEETLADRVLAFDVSADGRMVYTDGSRIFARATGATEWTEAARGKLIERVAIAE